MKTSLKNLLLSGLAVFASAGVSPAQDSEATRLLKERNAEFREEVIKVADNVYVAVGFGVSPSSMIVGTDGVIIVDTMIDTDSAARALAAFRKITDKPVKGIIFTHAHGDHTSGARAFIGDKPPQVWARDNFGAEGRTFSSALLTIQNVRGARQGGFTLPPEQRINNGVAKAYYPKRGGEIFTGAGDEKVEPTHTFSEPRKQIEIAGVKIELVAVDGETADALYVWLPEKKVLFSGDNFYKSWPNAYAIRGTPYRDIRSWAQANDTMSKEGAEVLVPGHTRPIVGKAEVHQALTDYRDAIRFVFTKTIEGMNKGMTSDQLVGYVKLPAHLAEKDYLREYYGNVEWAVRAIFDGYLGWFDGNPSNLFPLPPEEEARRMAKLAGGEAALLELARKALADGDAQWSAQFCDHLLALNRQAREPKLVKADALTALAEKLLTATGRNYYLTYAQELRAAASAKGNP
jgi:alkyl sulfatase BDS1-like metallo-beta-lactamase superfamily hydrolase